MDPLTSLDPLSGASAGAVHGRRGRPAPGRRTLLQHERVLVHLGTVGRLSPMGSAPVGLTQKGIGSALGLRQNSVSNLLRRLVDRGWVAQVLRSVNEEPRRLHVYSLTPLGEARYRDLDDSTLASRRPSDARRSQPPGHRPTHVEFD
jgi:DNA-binding MarR family transcriptional regulator